MTGSESALQRLAKVVVVSLVIASFAFRLALALGPIENLDGFAIPDDAYLFLDIARSIGQGDGPMYGREHTNGFQPLFAFLLAPIFWFCDGGDTPVHAALTLLVVADTFTLVLLCRLIRSVCDRSWLPPAVLAAGWVCNHNVLRNTLNGMETAVALLCITGAVAAHRRLFVDAEVNLTARRAFAIGASIGLAMLTRVDGILLIPAFSAWIGWRCLRGTLRIGGLPNGLGWYATGAALLFAPWILYSWYYTGDLYPVSGRAVRFQADAHYVLFPQGSTTWIHFRRAAGEIFRGNLTLIIASIVLLGGLLTQRAARRALVTRLRICVPLCCHAVILYVAYAGYIHGTWFFHRYLYPITILALLVTCILFHSLHNAIRVRQRTVATGLLLATCGVLAFGSMFTWRGEVRRDFHELVAGDRDGNFGYRAIGLWVRDRFPPGTVIGAKQSGAIGYYARGEVLNLDGVVNRSALAALTEHRMLEFLSTQAVDFYVLWEYDAEFLRFFSADASTHDLVRVEAVPHIHSWGDPGQNAFFVYRLEAR